MNIADLDRVIALRKRLDKLERKRAKVLRALAALGIDTGTEIYPARSGTAREAPSTQGGRHSGGQPPASVGVQPAAHTLTEAEIEERAVKAVMTAAYTSWQSGEITTEDFEGRKARYRDEINAAKAEIRNGPAAAEPCAICGEASTLIVQGDHFCAEHRPKPLLVLPA